MKTKLFFGVLLLLFISVSAGAVEVVFDKNFKTENMKIEDDYIFLGRKLVFSGNTEDLIFMGRDLDFTGKTELGLFAFGDKVSWYSTEPVTMVFKDRINRRLISRNETVPS